MNDNPLATIPLVAYEEPIWDARSWLGYQVFLSEPAGIKRVLLDDVANYPKNGARRPYPRYGLRPGNRPHPDGTEAGPHPRQFASLAMAEVSLLLATIAQRYHLKLAPDQNIVLQHRVTLRPRDGIRMTLQRRVP